VPAAGGGLGAPGPRGPSRSFRSSSLTTANKWLTSWIVCLKTLTSGAHKLIKQLQMNDSV
jgi:hypothetical protein